MSALSTRRNVDDVILSLDFNSFELLPGTVNARPGMKFAKLPEEAPREKEVETQLDSLEEYENNSGAGVQIYYFPYWQAQYIVPNPAKKKKKNKKKRNKNRQRKNQSSDESTKSQTDSPKKSKRRRHKQRRRGPNNNFISKFGNYGTLSERVPTYPQYILSDGQGYYLSDPSYYCHQTYDSHGNYLHALVH